MKVLGDSDEACLIWHTQYTLSQETVEALKKPTFDVWHWEHNEVCRCCHSVTVTLIQHLDSRALKSNQTKLFLCDDRC